MSRNDEFVWEKGSRIKEILLKSGVHRLTLESLPADFYRMTRSQMERLYEHICDDTIAKMYGITKDEVTKRRRDFGVTPLYASLTKLERENECIKELEELLKIVIEEYYKGNLPHW